MSDKNVWDEVDAFLAEHENVKMSFGLEYSSVIDWVADFTPRRNVPGSRDYANEAWRYQAADRDEAIRGAMKKTRAALVAAKKEIK